MISPKLGVRLRTSLGFEACDDLNSAFEEVQNDMLATTAGRLEGLRTGLAADLHAELAKSEGRLRVEMVEGFAAVRRDILDMRVEVLRWAFAFWLGQFAATVGLLAFVLRPR